MDEMPNDSGGSPTERSILLTDDSAGNDNETGSTEHRIGIDISADRMRPPTAQVLRDQLQRPATWGLLVLIVGTLVVQFWLLFL